MSVWRERERERERVSKRVSERVNGGEIEREREHKGGELYIERENERERV